MTRGRRRAGPPHERFEVREVVEGGGGIREQFGPEAIVQVLRSEERPLVHDEAKGVAGRVKLGDEMVVHDESDAASVRLASLALWSRSLRRVCRETGTLPMVSRT